MTGFRDMDERLAAFARAYEAGDGDPVPFMEGLDETGRRRFQMMVSDYLEENPERQRDVSRLKDPAMARLIGSVASRLDGASGGMSRLVVDLREGRHLLQEDVVEALATELDATDTEKEKIDDYYHDLEFGNLPARGISGKLLTSLGRILGTTAEKLREAGQALGPSGSPATGLIFTRMADDAEDVVVSGLMPSMEVPSGRERRSDPPDRIDELFTGG